MAQKYQITQTIPTTYVNKSGQVVNGYTVHLNLIKWDEMHTIQVATLDPKTVDAAARDLYTKREQLDTLGSDTGK